MDRTTLKLKAHAHWAKWLPKKVAELRASGELAVAIHLAAVQAQAGIAELMALGYQEHEAAEVVLPQLILLTPEEPDEDDWEAEELAEMEREYQEMMRPFVDEK